MTIHIFSDDASSEGRISTDTSLGSSDSGKSSSRFCSVKRGISDRCSESIPSGGRDQIYSSHSAPTVEILCGAQNSIEVGLSDRFASEFISELFKPDSYTRSHAPDPVLEIDEATNRRKRKRICILLVMALLFFAMIATGSAYLSKSQNQVERETYAARKDNIFNQSIGDPRSMNPSDAIETAKPSEVTDESFERTNAPTSGELESPRIQVLRDILASESSREDLYSSSTDQYAAMKWLADEDPAELDFDEVLAQDIKDRYKASLIYFALNKGSGWRNIYGFLSANPICSWNDSGQGYAFEGIRCEGGKVVDVTLDMNRLEGTIPSEIALFDLRSLSFGSNTIYGTIPTELGGLVNLTSLKLGSNKLVGSLPSEFGKLLSLQALLLHENDIEGTIPSTYDSLMNLKHLFIEGTKLSGDIDSIFCNRENNFENFYADCASEAGVTCSCCTSCCNSEGKSCSGKV